MRVLLVEDQVDLRDAVARRLRAVGHGVDVADSIGSAGEMIVIHAYDVVILDRLLPDGDTVVSLQAWRRRGLAAPVLFLTSLDRVEDRVAGLEAGADDYLVKPFAMDELLARVRAIGRRGVSTRPSVLRVADLEFDVARHEVRRSGVLLPLRPKELAVLELLLIHAGQVVRRSDIIEHCWDEYADPFSNVEEVVIASLRRKLGPPPLIRTVRGAGYLLEDGAAGG